MCPTNEEKFEVKASEAHGRFCLPCSLVPSRVSSMPLPTPFQGTQEKQKRVNVAKVAKWTRLTPKMIQIFGGQNHGLAKACMTRRLRRLFNFLDSDSAGFVTNVDLKCFYVTVLQDSLVPA